MPRGAKPGQRRGGRERGTPNKRTTELAEAANNVLVNAGRAPLPKIAVLRKLGKERLIEIDEIAMALVYKYRAAAEEGDVLAEALLWKYLGLALDAAARRAPFESPRLAAIAVQEQKEEKRKVTGESARHRLLQVVLNVIAAEDAEASRRASEIETAACELEADAVAREAPITIEAKAEPAPELEPDDGDGSLA